MKYNQGDKLKIQKLKQFFNNSEAFTVYNQSFIEKQLKRGYGAGEEARSHTFSTKKEAKDYINRLTKQIIKKRK